MYLHISGAVFPFHSCSDENFQSCIHVYSVCVCVDILPACNVFVVEWTVVKTIYEVDDIMLLSFFHCCSVLWNLLLVGVMLLRKKLFWLKGTHMSATLKGNCKLTFLLELCRYFGTKRSQGSGLNFSKASRWSEQADSLAWNYLFHVHYIVMEVWGIKMNLVFAFAG